MSLNLHRGLNGYVEFHNCSGFYHGMMALARRNISDDYNNSNPLSWEIRSVSPSIFSKYPTLAVEAIRAYGFLRSLLAEPKHDESLDECINREYSETNGEILGNTSDLKFVDNIKLDLIKQPPLPSGIGVVERLLPKWRKKFYLSIQNRKIKLDNKILSEQISKLENLKENSDKNIQLANDLFIPIAAWDYSVKYGIRIASIFSDLSEFKKGSFNEPITGININNQAKSIITWLNQLLILAGGENPYEKHLNNATNLLKNKESAQSLWKNMESMDRCLAYSLAIVRSEVLPTIHKTLTDEDLALDIGIPYNERTFRDSFKRTNFCECKNSSEFRSKFILALRNEEVFFIPKSLREAVIKYCNNSLKRPKETIEQRLPGLFDKFIKGNS